MRVGAVVEGDGDVCAVPVLVARLGNLFGINAFAPRPVRAGNHIRLAALGQLEKYVIMAATQPDTELVLILLDSDDDCPIDIRGKFEARLNALRERFSIPIHLCLCEREYEAWFLDSLPHLAATATAFEWTDASAIPDAWKIRGAKERLQSRMDKHYKEISDQAKLTSQIDLAALYRNNRSFRCVVKALTGFSYADLDEHFA